MSYCNVHVKKNRMSPGIHPFHFFANAFQYPDSSSLIEKGTQLLGSLSRDFGVPFHSMPHPALGELQVEYMRLFVNSPAGVAAPPYASYYRHDARLLFQEGMVEAEGFYREAALAPPEGPEPPDHISTELAFVGTLLDSGRDDILARFLESHVLRWYPAFHECLAAARPASWYMLLADVTGASLKRLHEEVLNEEKRLS